MAKKRSGVTMIEVLLAVGIVAFLATVGVISLTGRKSKVELTGTVDQVTGLLREAQAKSMVQSSSTSWGVYFHNATATAPYFSLFSGTSFASGRERGHYRLPSGIQFTTSTLGVGATTSVYFAQITGLASASTTIGFTNGKGTSVTIRVASSGAVSY